MAPATSSDLSGPEGPGSRWRSRGRRVLLTAIHVSMTAGVLPHLFEDEPLRGPIRCGRLSVRDIKPGPDGGMTPIALHAVHVTLMRPRGRPEAEPLATPDSRVHIAPCPVHVRNNPLLYSSGCLSIVPLAPRSLVKGLSSVRKLESAHFESTRTPRTGRMRPRARGVARTCPTRTAHQGFRIEWVMLLTTAA